MRIKYYPVMSFRQKDIIFRKGDLGDRMYEVMDGAVGIYLHYGEEGETLLATYETGDFFGEIALLEVRPRTATAVALYDDTKLRVIFRKGYTDYFVEKPYTLTKILDLMANRFKWQRQEYFVVCKTVAELSDVLSGKQEATPALLSQAAKYTEAYQRSLETQKNEEQVGFQYSDPSKSNKEAPKEK